MIKKLENIGKRSAGERKVNQQSQSLIKQVGLNGRVQEILEIRVPELINYQNLNYAKTYIENVQKVAQKEQEFMPRSTDLTEAIGKYLYKLMAYKDEYEVARLHTKKGAKEAIKKQFGPNAKYSILLHPPIFRAMGYNKKMRFGTWTLPLFSLMSKFKFLRGTAFDLFGYAEVRRTERALVQEYQQLIDKMSNNLSAENYDKMVAIAKLPDMIRGYEDIKMENVKEYREKVQEMLA